MPPNRVLALRAGDELMASLTLNCKISGGNAAILKTCFESLCLYSGRTGQVKRIYVES
jgi:hypothetical protein